MSIPADAWPRGDRTEWADDATRTLHDFFNETQRPYTAEENAAADARLAVTSQERNRAALVAAATKALVDNRTFLALTTVSTAAATAQIKALTRQMNAVIRLTVGALDQVDEVTPPAPVKGIGGR